jgi:hypothetical protein
MGSLKSFGALYEIVLLDLFAAVAGRNFGGGGA